MITRYYNGVPFGRTTISCMGALFFIAIGVARPSSADVTFPLEVKWSATLGAPPAFAPAYDDNQVYVSLRTNELVAAVTAIPGVRLRFEGPRFHEAVLVLDRPVRGLLEGLAARNILGGHDLTAEYPDLGNALLVCATETKTSNDIGNYAAALRELITGSRH